jgi:hypothetical protein
MRTQIGVNHGHSRNAEFPVRLSLKLDSNVNYDIELHLAKQSSSRLLTETGIEFNCMHALSEKADGPYCSYINATSSTSVTALLDPDVGQESYCQGIRSIESASFP